MSAALVDMSRAIRTTIAQYGDTLTALDDDVLAEFAAIVCAFALDLKGEMERRRRLA